jgi:hypothetical protein
LLVKGFSVVHRDAVIRVYDEAGNVIATHEHAGGFQRVVSFARITAHFLIIPWKRIEAARVYFDQGLLPKVPKIFQTSFDPQGNASESPCTSSV